MAQAAAEINAHPRYAAYEVVEVKRDESDSGKYAAHLTAKRGINNGSGSGASSC
jgi:hypothetical protein